MTTWPITPTSEEGWEDVTPPGGFDLSTARPISKAEEAEFQARLEQERSQAKSAPGVPVPRDDLPDALRRAAPVQYATERAELEALRRLEREASVKGARTTAVVTATSWWLGIVLATYALGWSVGWVRQGFRKEGP